MVKLTNETSETCKPTTCADSCSVTSSPALPDGRMRFDWQDGLMPEPSGPEVVPANRGAWRERIKGPTIPAIFGRRGAGSSASVALSRSLESRLRQQMPSCGLIALRRTWKAWDTPSGRSFSRLLVSAPHTNVTDFTLWPTPTAQRQSGGIRFFGGTRARNKWVSLGVLPTGKADLCRLAAWMMGFPMDWLNASSTVSAMPSSRKSRRK